METRPESDEVLIRRLLPSLNPNRQDRIQAWTEWQGNVGETALMKFIRLTNNSQEPDEDILQEAFLVAYQEVERGRYQPRPGVPFTAYVKGIARNRIREARRRERSRVSLDEIEHLPSHSLVRQIEQAIEDRQEWDVLARGLAALPKVRRQVLERYLLGESTSEIAARSAMTEVLVRQHKSRAIRALRDQASLRQGQITISRLGQS